MRTIQLMILVAVVISSCRRSTDCDPNKICNSERPDSSWVNIRFSYSTHNAPIPFTLYNGTVENNEIVITDTAYADKVSFYLPIQKRYSVKAVYSKNGTTINAHDGGKLRLEKSWNCDVRCFEAPPLNLDVALIE